MFEVANARVTGCRYLVRGRGKDTSNALGYHGGNIVQMCDWTVTRMLERTEAMNAAL